MNKNIKIPSFSKTENAIIESMVDKVMGKPSCTRCGATSLKQAERMCRVSGGDDDDCPGVYIKEWD